MTIKILESVPRANLLKLTRYLKNPKGKFFVVFLVFVFFLAVSISPLSNKSKNSAWADQPTSFVNVDQVLLPLNNAMTLSDNGVALPITSPLFISSESLASLMQSNDFDGQTVDNSIIKYTVQKGETLSQIAEKFNISVETILLANELSTSKIKEGQELVILPISGIMHMVEKGETLDFIAKQYGAEAGQIAEFNNLGSSNEVFMGDVLIIPNGVAQVEPEKPEAGVEKPKTLTKVATNKPKVEYIDDTPEIVVNSNISSAFIAPTKGKITQGAHYSYTSGRKNYYSAVDIGGDYGTPVVAAAAGKIQIVKNAWPYGMYVTISHDNGTMTLYSHLSAFAEGIISGATVTQGQIIAYMGNTGHVVRFRGGTGTHLHFEVRGGTNPLASRGIGANISY